MLRAATADDGQAIAQIYNHYIENTSVTFEETPVSAEEMTRRIANVHAANLPWLVMETPEGVVGYAYATKWRERSAYRYSVESTVYLHKNETGKGYGRQLYEELLAILRNTGIHVVIGGIALPNESSTGLHEKLGFQNVARFREVGMKFGRWLDVGYWELIL